MFRYGISKQKQILCFLLVSISKNTFYLNTVRHDLHRMKRAVKKATSFKIKYEYSLHKKKEYNFNNECMRGNYFQFPINYKKNATATLLLLRNNLFSTWTQEVPYGVDKSIV